MYIQNILKIVKITTNGMDLFNSISNYFVQLNNSESLLFQNGYDLKSDGLRGYLN